METWPGLFIEQKLKEARCTVDLVRVLSAMLKNDSIDEVVVCIAEAVNNIPYEVLPEEAFNSFVTKLINELEGYVQ